MDYPANYGRSDVQQTSFLKVASGSSVKFSPEPLIEESWTWTGPERFTGTTKEVTLANLTPQHPVLT